MEAMYKMEVRLGTTLADIAPQNDPGHSPELERARKEDVD
jgi:hypothetical protein